MHARLLICLLATGNVAAADGVFTGYARDLRTNALLYVESHAVADAGTSRERRVVLYQCADGSPFARKELTYAGDRSAPGFGFEDARSGYADGLTRDARGLEVYERSGKSAPLRRERVDGAGLVADAGFDEFVRANWSTLESGKAVDAPFLVPSRLGSMPFRVRKIGEAQIGDDTVSVIRLSLAGLLRFFLPDIDVSYRKRDRALMRYRGTTNIRDANGKLLEAQIDFPAAERREVTVDLPALAARPLVETCGS
ncbi:MAG: hypothetical protein H7Y89_17055 [Steroidobacteraceae bacterium]|nr:hypothetical protein [Steroidobacteraceae bacterium]